MSKKVLINGYEYTYIKGYRDNENLRDGLNKLTEETYGFNFRKWYEAGYWGEGYIPYSLLDDDKLVANVSVNIMKINILGEEKNYIQIGTVIIQDVFMDKEIDLNIVIDLLMNEDTKIIRLGFTPINIEEYNKELLNDDNDALYVKSKNKSVFNNENIMFPILSHA